MSEESQVGINNCIHESFQHGDNFKIGSFCVIEEDVVVGNNVRIENFVLLKKGTHIGDDVYVDSYVRSSGANKIGNSVVLRFGSTIAREVTVEDTAFISPNVMTIYSTHQGEKKGGIVIGAGAHIGTAAIIGPGLEIGPGVVIGAGAVVTRNCLEPGVYMGTPAKKR